MRLADLQNIFRAAARQLREVGDTQGVVVSGCAFVVTKTMIGDKGVAIIVREVKA